MHGRFALVAIASVLISLAGAVPASAGKASRADRTPPTVAIGSPVAGATVGGTVTVLGAAHDNGSLVRVELSVDGGPYALASGTSSWSATMDTNAFADGLHTITARAGDSAGNLATASVTLDFLNAPPPAPTPAPDTAPPTIAVTSPSAGATLAGTVDVVGTAADDRGVVKVDLSVDGAGWSLATGTSAWTWPWNTTVAADGAHTISARATDAAGNSTTTTQSDTLQNATPAPTLPAGVRDQLVTPEGATIQIYSDVTGWTAQQVYELLAPSAYELARVGPRLTVKVQTTYPSQTTTTASTSGGVYTSYKATIYLRATATSGFTAKPDFTAAHEYGHAWSMYHLFLTEQGNWGAWLEARGLAGDPRVDSNYNWSKNEMLADDYRMLFGSPAAVSQSAYINPEAPDPRDVEGLRDFLATRW